MDRLDRRSYVERYLAAKELNIGSYGTLAQLAFNLVQARFRLADISLTEAADNESRLAAQRSEVIGWKAKADRYVHERAGRLHLFEEMIADFSTMAAAAREPDDYEQTLMALGRAGRNTEVTVDPVVEAYTYQQGSYGARDSAFASSEVIET